MRLILARLVWNFEMDLVDDSFDPRNQEAYNFWEKPPLNIRFIERNDKKA